MWCLEAHSCRTVQHVSRGNRPSPVSFGTVRSIRSAAAQFYQWDALISSPSASLLTKEGRLLYQACRPTDSLSMQMFSTGLAKRLGTVVVPSKAVLERHVLALDQDLEHRFSAPYSPSMQRIIALGGFANVTLGLAWLWSAETFSLTYDDVVTTPPASYWSRDLPFGIGMLEYLLLPETKSAQTFCADVIVADVEINCTESDQWILCC